MEINQQLNIRQVCALTTLSKTTIYGLMKKKDFPAPRKIKGTRRVAWTARTVQNWINEKEAA